MVTKYHFIYSLDQNAKTFNTQGKIAFNSTLLLFQMEKMSSEGNVFMINENHNVFAFRMNFFLKVYLSVYFFQYYITDVDLLNFCEE